MAELPILEHQLVFVSSKDFRYLEGNVIISLEATDSKDAFMLLDRETLSDASPYLRGVLSPMWQRSKKMLDSKNKLREFWEVKLCYGRDLGMAVFVDAVSIL